MRNFFITLVMTFVATFTVVNEAQAQISPGKVFDMFGGTTSIDRGGAIHSQTRSIYSLGGGMTSFKGKTITLMSVDPFGFNAGCSGISWHFGGFAFISVDEIRQLVEAVSQASLGVAVDLAMETLCPTCYAVMSKLRELSNMMRNAAADACQIAQHLGNMLRNSSFVSSLQRKNKCSSNAADNNKSDSFFGAMFDNCKTPAAVESALKAEGEKVLQYFGMGNKNPSGQPGQPGQASTPTPNAETLYDVGNHTYTALEALGYPDGVIKDVLMSILGMVIVDPVPNTDCRATLENAFGSAKGDGGTLDTLAASIIDSVKPDTVPETTANGSTPNQANVTPPQLTGSQVDKSKVVCYAPPIMKGVDDLAKRILCGFNPEQDVQTFANRFSMSRADIANSSFGAMCGVTTSGSKLGASEANPPVYHCTKEFESRCARPKLMRLKDIMATDTSKPYTGVVWMVMDALYIGAKAIKDSKSNETPETSGKSKFPRDTVRIINSSNYPLYRVLNIAAVYPDLANELLQAYGGLIATHYVMDTMEKLVAPGSQPQISLRSQTGGFDHQEIAALRREITTDMTNKTTAFREQVQKRLSEKKALIDVIQQINKTIQAEVMSQGLTGNNGMAMSIKRSMSAPATGNAGN